MQTIPVVVIFDVDGTLTRPWTAEFLNQRRPMLQALRLAGRKLYLASNQGGPAYHAWHAIKSTHKGNSYPSLMRTIEVMESVRQQAGANHCYIALHPGDKNIARDLLKHWSIDANNIYRYANENISASYRDDWRKPQSGMLTTILEDTRTAPTQCLYVGNEQIDFDAAHTAGIAFADADDFFFGGWQL